MRKVWWARGIAAAMVVLAGAPTAAMAGGSAGDTMQLTDTPGNWFRSEASGTPVSTVRVGERVDFEGGELTNTRHTATLVIKPVGSRLTVDQDAAKNGGIASAEFDAPGVYLFLCKVHPYMTGVVAVADGNGDVPPVTAEQLPFIGHLGANALPAGAVLGVLPAVAPTDADKRAKWDIAAAADAFNPATPGVGEVWLNTQFEAVSGQTDDHGVPKPGTITVVDAASLAVEREVTGLDPDARLRWNNPHNMWADTLNSVVYNGHWFGRWHNKIARATGDVLTTVEVGDAPTHTMTNPARPAFSTLPLSARDVFRTLEDPGGNAAQKIVDSDPTGVGRNHPHAQWMTSDGRMTVFPNVFKGLGVAGSISVVETGNNRIVREFRAPEIAMPVAAGIQGVTQGNKAYVANIVSGQVTVIDLDTMHVLRHIPVTLTPDCRSGSEFDVFHTLQVPIQTPVSPDGRFVATAVLSLSTVDRPCTGSPDHVAVIDTRTDEVVRFVGIPARPGTANGAHGVNFGMKLGDGWYAYVASQFSNMLTVLDLDPNGDHSAADGAVAGRVLLANGQPGGARVTDGVGGQGVKPLPTPYDGWIQDTVAAAAQTDPEVRGWLAVLTRCQRDPSAAGCGASATTSAAADVAPPVVSNFSLTRRRFRVGGRSTPLAARAAGRTRRASRGTAFRFSLSEAAEARLRIARALPGRRAEGRCGAPSRRNRGGPGCTRYQLRGALVRRSLTAGRNSLRFSGHLGRRTLAPGAYRATLVATDAAGNHSHAARARFRIVR